LDDPQYAHVHSCLRIGYPKQALILVIASGAGQKMLWYKELVGSTERGILRKILVSSVESRAV
jgi:hypothetical protein